MHITVREGYVPGCIGRIAQLHANYYSAANGFGVNFEAKVARKLADFCQNHKPGRDGIWLALRNGHIEGPGSQWGSLVSEQRFECSAA